VRNAITPNNPPLQETPINMGILKRGYARDELRKKTKKDRKKKENAGNKGEDATMEMWHRLSCMAVREHG